MFVIGLKCENREKVYVQDKKGKYDIWLVKVKLVLICEDKGLLFF